MNKKRSTDCFIILILITLFFVSIPKSYGDTKKKNKLIKQSINNEKDESEKRAVLGNKKIVSNEPLVIDLDKAVKIAIGKNPQMKIAHSQIKDAQGKYEEAKSGLGFKLGLRGSYTRIDPVAKAEIPINGPDKPAEVFEMGAHNIVSGQAVLEKIITTFGFLENSIAAAALQVNVQKWNYKSVRQNVSFQTRSDYFKTLKAVALVGVSREALSIAKQQLKISNDLFSAGVVPRYDVLRAELAVSRAQQELVVVQNARKLAKASLLNTLGIPQDQSIVLKDERETNLFKVDEAKVQALAAKNRPEVASVLFAKKSLEFLLKAAYRSNAPSLVFSSTYDVKTNTGFGSVPHQLTNVVALSIPLFDGGEKSAKVKQADAALQKINGTLEQLYQSLQLEVKQAVLMMRETQSRLKAASKDVETSTEGYAIALTRYENGLSTQLELNDAMRALNTSRANYLNVLYDYNIALAKLEKAVGVSWKGVVTDANLKKKS